MFKLSALSGFGLPRVLNLRDTQGVNTETFAIEYSSQLLKIIDNNIDIIIGKVKKCFQQLCYSSKMRIASITNHTIEKKMDKKSLNVIITKVGTLPAAIKLVHEYLAWQKCRRAEHSAKLWTALFVATKSD